MKLFPNRIYKPGSKYCFWRWTFSHHVHNQPVTRLIFFRTPRLTIGLHWLNGPDPDRNPHDHNMPFVSLILRGGYIERRKDGSRSVYYWNSFKAGKDDWHVIQSVRPKTLTLFFMGRDTGESYVYPMTGKISRKEYNRNKDV